MPKDPKVIEQEKFNHLEGLRILAAQALEHGLLLLPANDAARKEIESDIVVVRTGDEFDIADRYKLAKRRKMSYSVPGLLLQGSVKMLYLAKHRGYPPSGLLYGLLYYPAEAADLADIGKNWEIPGRVIEQKWQEENILPGIKRLFENWGQPLEAPKSNA